MIWDLRSSSTDIAGFAAGTQLKSYKNPLDIRRKASCIHNWWPKTTLGGLRVTVAQ